MVHIGFEQNVNAAAAEVWDCYMGSRALELATGVYAESITVEGEGVGSVRVSKLLGGGGTLRERLDALDEKNFHCKYSVIERGAMPFADYKGEIKVTPTGPNTCILRLQADFTAVGMGEQQCIALYLDNNLKGIAKMKAMLGLD